MTRSINSAFLKQNIDLRGKRVLVMGLGATGSTAELIKYLVKHDARVTVTDLKSDAELTKTKSMLFGLDVSFSLGGHNEQDFKSCDILFINPAVRLDDPHIQIAVLAGSKLDSEINLFYRLCKTRRVIAVTGTKGKTTTSKLICHILSNLGYRTWYGGNNGVSLVNDADKISRRDYVVLELSSFQLQMLGLIGFKPRVACCHEIVEEHLDHHKSFNEYVTAKSFICRNQCQKDIKILYQSLEGLSQFKSKSRKLTFSNDCRSSDAFITDSKIVIRGVQLSLNLNFDLLCRVLNWNNLLCALLAVKTVLKSSFAENLPSIERCLGTFKTNRFRMELTAEFNGVTVINDSAATHPASTLNALMITRGRPVILVLGGKEKGIDLNQWMPKFSDFDLKRVILIGPVANKLQSFFKMSQMASTFNLAVEQAILSASSGDVVLFSPGFSSLYEFSNYEDRGLKFEGEVNLLLSGVRS